MAVNITIADLGDKFQDYRDPILGDSYNWGPVVNPHNVQYFAFHHSVTAQTAKLDGNWKAECDKIASIHVNTNGWGGVGYRFIICSDGTVAYVGDLSHGGSAVADHNDIIVSACLVGDFTKELPTAAQIHSAHLLAKFFLTQMPDYANLTSWDQIKGHKEFSVIFNEPLHATACPGSNWKGISDSLYNRIVGDLWQGYPNPQPVIPQPTPEPVPTPTPEPPPPPYIPLPDPLIAQIKAIVYDRWTWIGTRGWKNRLSQLKTVLK